MWVTLTVPLTRHPLSFSCPKVGWTQTCLILNELVFTLLAKVVLIPNPTQFVSLLLLHRKQKAEFVAESLLPSPLGLQVPLRQVRRLLGAPRVVKALANALTLTVRRLVKLLSLYPPSATVTHDVSSTPVLAALPAVPPYAPLAVPDAPLDCPE